LLTSIYISAFVYNPAISFVWVDFYLRIRLFTCPSLHPFVWLLVYDVCFCIRL